MTAGEYLTAGEQEALEVKSLRKRAKAVQHFLRLAEQLDISEEQTGAIVEKIRQADAGEWSRLQKAAGHMALFLADVPKSAPAEAPAVVVEQEALNSDAETTLEAVDNDGGIGEQGMAILRRLTGDRTLTAQDLHTDDITQIIDAIGNSTLSGKLLDETRTKLEQVLSGVPYKDVASSHPTIGNLRTSIKKAHNEAALRALLTRATESRPLQAVPRPPSAPFMFTPVVARHESEVEVLDGAAVSIVVEDEDPETIEEILRVGLERPQAVSPAEWREAAYAKLTEAAPTYLSEKETVGLWDWIHFDETKELPTEIGADGHKALQKLLTLYLSTDKTYFHNAPYQNLAASTLLNVARGVKSLPEICEKLRTKKPLDPGLTNNVAQRHVVAAVTHLLEQGR